MHEKTRGLGSKCQDEESRLEGRALSQVMGDNYLTRELCPGLVLRAVNKSWIIKETKQHE